MRAPDPADDAPVDTKRPLVITGMARAGTSWLGKMLEACGEFVYVNEPLNPRHPPGRSPGILDAPVPFEYLHIPEGHDGVYLDAFTDMFALRYHVIKELKQNRKPFDLLKMFKYVGAFASGRMRGKRPLLNDPYAVLSLPWLHRHFSCDIVAIVRDPAAVVASHQRQGYRAAIEDLLSQPELMREQLAPLADDLGAAADQSADEVSRLSLLWTAIYACVDSWRQALPRLVIVRYEDLAQDPEHAFQQLYDTLALPFHDSARQAIIAGTTGSSKTQAHSWRVSRTSLLSRTAYRPMDSRSNIDAWRAHLSPEEVQRIRTITEDVASRYYQPLSGPLGSNVHG